MKKMILPMIGLAICFFVNAEETIIYPTDEAYCNKGGSLYKSTSEIDGEPNATRANGSPRLASTDDGGKAIYRFDIPSEFSINASQITNVEFKLAGKYFTNGSSPYGNRRVSAATGNIIECDNSWAEGTGKSVTPIGSVLATASYPAMSALANGTPSAEWLADYQDAKSYDITTFFKAKMEAGVQFSITAYATDITGYFLRLAGSFDRTANPSIAPRIVVTYSPTTGFNNVQEIGFNAWGTKGAIVISGKEDTYTVRNMTGKTVSVIKSVLGEQSVINNLNTGIYIISASNGESKKITVK